METIFIFAALVFGFVLWWIYYGLECYINGEIGCNQYAMRFRLMWEEFLWILPGGKKRKLEYCNGNEDLADTLPGPLHFICTHILLPFGPAVVAYYVIWR
jgi:hypothetical protein